MTEDDIWEEMSRFGEVVKAKIPTELMRNGNYRNKGFAFVTFRTSEMATLAIEEAEIAVDNAILEIERAMKRPMLNGKDDRSGGPVVEFDQLKSFKKK